MAKKKTGATTNKTGADQSGSSDDGRKRRNGTNGARNGQSPRVAAPAVRAVTKRSRERRANTREQQQQQQQQRQQPSVRSEPSGWAAIVTGTLSPSEVSAVARETAAVADVDSNVSNDSTTALARVRVKTAT